MTWLNVAVYEEQLCCGFLCVCVCVTVPKVTHKEVVEIEDTGDRDRSTSDACSITPQFTPPVKVSPQNPDTPPDKTKRSPISPDWNAPFAFHRSYSLPVSAPPMQYIYPRDVSYFVVQCYLWPSCLTMIECCNVCTALYIQFVEISTSSRLSKSSVEVSV